MAAYQTQEWLLDLLAGNANQALNLHAPDFGAAWVNNGDLKLDGAGGVYANSVVANRFGSALTTGAVPTGDQLVSCQVTKLSALAARAGVVARWSGASSHENGYAFAYSQADSCWVCSEWVDGVKSDLLFCDNVAGALGVGETQSGLMVIEDALISCYVNGLLAQQGELANQPGPGQTGIILVPAAPNAAATGIHVRQLLASYVPA